jgi:hypothetical protein
MRGFASGCALAAGLFLAASSSAGSAPPPAEIGSRVTTLYRHDPLRSAISLATGEDGRYFEGGYARNRNCDLDFGNNNADALTIGIETGRKGVLIDLGSTEDLAKRFAYVEPVGGGQGYASIHYVGGRLMITRAVEGTFQPIPEGPVLLAGSAEGATAPAALGHVYLARLVDSREPGFERIAKILVVSHVTGESVTIRWDLLTR